MPKTKSRDRNIGSQESIDRFYNLTIEQFLDECKTNSFKQIAQKYNFASPFRPRHMYDCILDLHSSVSHNQSLASISGYAKHKKIKTNLPTKHAKPLIDRLTVRELLDALEEDYAFDELRALYHCTPTTIYKCIELIKRTLVFLNFTLNNPERIDIETLSFKTIHSHIAAIRNAFQSNCLDENTQKKILEYNLRELQNGLDSLSPSSTQKDDTDTKLPGTILSHLTLEEFLNHVEATKNINQCSQVMTQLFNKKYSHRTIMRGMQIITQLLQLLDENVFSTETPDFNIFKAFIPTLRIVLQAYLSLKVASLINVQINPSEDLTNPFTSAREAEEYMQRVNSLNQPAPLLANAHDDIDHNITTDLNAEIPFDDLTNPFSSVREVEEYMQRVNSLNQPVPLLANVHDDIDHNITTDLNAEIPFDNHVALHVDITNEGEYHAAPFLLFSSPSQIKNPTNLMSNFDKMHLFHTIKILTDNKPNLPMKVLTAALDVEINDFKQWLNSCLFMESPVTYELFLQIFQDEYSVGLFQCPSILLETLPASPTFYF